MSEILYVTRNGYDKLKEELRQLETVELPAATDRVAAARAEGDLSENAEYHGARETQGMIQAKVNLLRDKLSRVQIVDTSTVPQDEVALGATIVIRDLDLDETEELTLVGAGEEDYDVGRILVTSPLGKGFLGQKVGAEVAIPVPKGTLRYSILEIRYEVYEEGGQ